MKVAYADPPYLGLAQRFYGKHHPDAARWDRIESHAELLADLNRNYDGWAYSLHTPSLQTILTVAPQGIRICAWVKPFCSFKPGVPIAYAWEPVLLKPARPPSAYLTPRDYISTPIATQAGLRGAKPQAFALWLFALLGLTPDDDFHDLFPGSGNISRAHSKWAAQLSLLSTLDQ